MNDALTLDEVRRLNRGEPVPGAYHRAVAILAAGRLEITTRTHRIIEAEVIGSTGERRYIRSDLDGFRCSCPGWHHRHHCVHIDAVRLVTAEPGYRRLPPTRHGPAGVRFDQENPR